MVPFLGRLWPWGIHYKYVSYLFASWKFPPPPRPVRKKTGNKFLSANSSILTPEPSAQTIRPYYTATLIIRGAQVLLIMLIYSGDCLPSTSMETMHAPCVIRNPIILEEIESLCDAPVLNCTAGRRMSNRKRQGITLDKLCAYANAIV